MVVVTIFDLSFAAIPDLNKQAEDIDFFFQEYIRFVKQMVEFNTSNITIYYFYNWNWNVKAF